jgi:hypothetical protein
MLYANGGRGVKLQRVQPVIAVSAFVVEADIRAPFREDSR